MSECLSYVKKQVALVKMIKTNSEGLPDEWQYKIYDSVNKWLISDRIQKERNKNGNNYRNYRGKK